PKLDQIELSGEPLVGLTGQSGSVPPAIAPVARGKRQRVWLAIPAVLIAAAIGGAAMFGKHDEPVAPQAPPTSASTVTVTGSRPGPTDQAHLGINAFPWARVTSIRNLDDHTEVKIDASMVTPVLVDLPNGKYSVTLSHPDFRD